MKDIPLPPRLQNRPTFKGLPVPYLALEKPDGTPDFRVIDTERRLQVIVDRRCQLCGQPLGKFIFFVGGKIAAAKKEYFEPAAHLDCVVYSMQVCPFILGKMEHADIAKVQAAHPGVALQENPIARSEWWVIIKAGGYKVNPESLHLTPHPVLYETEPLHPESMTAGDWARVQATLHS